VRLLLKGFSQGFVRGYRGRPLCDSLEVSFVSAGVKLGVLLTLDCSVQPAGGLLLTATFPQSPESIPKVALDRSNTRSLLGYHQYTNTSSL